MHPMHLKLVAMKAGLAPSPEHAARWRAAMQEILSRLSTGHRFASRKRSARRQGTRSGRECP
jgi:hypothetical protein